MTRSVLDGVLEQKCRLFRPPFGKLSTRSLIPAWLANQQVVMWTVDLKDYRATTAEIEAQPRSNAALFRRYHSLSRY